jgi:hypothetical protein
MTIQSGDIKLLKSQVLLDTSDGGGAMTSEEVVDGLSNNLFADVSELDRTYGRVALRKTFPAVDTTTNDSYYGSHAIISRVPEDPRVSISLFTTKDWFDRRTQARDKIERYLARGPKWAGHLLEMQLEGQRAIQLCVRALDIEPKVGQGLNLVQFEGLMTEYEQYVRVTKITTAERTFTVQGKDVIRKVITVEISDPLRFNFEGSTVEQFETGNLGKAVCRDTRVANAATYYGAARLTNAASMNDASIQADTIFTQLVPSAQSETPMVDLNAAALSSLYVPGNDNVITTTVSAPVGSNTKLYVGNSVIPGTFSLTITGNTIRDAGGDLKNGSTIVGSIEYDKGLCTFNANVPNYTGAMNLTFKPAAVPTRVADTASISIIEDTRGYNYTITLLPIPQPGSLVVSYMSQGKVYFLYDRGDGVLKGSDTAFGTGAISYTTGSVIITTGALPDASSEIIFAWGKKVSTFTRADYAVSPARIELQLANQQTAPGSVVITWTLNNVAKTAVDDGNGNITGDATGTINYASSKIKLIPTLLYQQGTELQVAYSFGPPNSQAFPMPTRDGSGNVTVTLDNIGGNIIPKSVELVWNVDIMDSPQLGTIFTETEQTWNPPPPPFRRDPLVQAFDNGTGGFRLPGGTAQPGTINYSTRTISLSPELNVQIPKPVWSNQLMGETQSSRIINGGNLTSTVKTYRRIIGSWQMVPTIASMPIDEKGYLTVKWRTSAAANNATETFQVGELKFDLTPGFAEDILQGSSRFIVGGLTYIDRLGTLYHSVNNANGAGVVAGSIAYQSGLVTLTSWAPGSANSVDLKSLVTEMNVQPVDEVVFRVPIAPVRTGSVQIRALPIEGNNGDPINVTADGTGKISSPYMVGSVDYQSGVVRIRFGQKVTVDAGVIASSWYNADAVFTENSVQKIIKPRPVYADSIRYNAVGYTYLPLSADILGMDPVRLPSDGRVPIFRQSDVVVVHHTDNAVFPGTPASGSVVDVGRVRVSYIKVYDAQGTALDPNMYETNLDAGTVTLKSNYSLGVLVLPLHAEHRVEDMAVVTDVQINGKLALNRVLTHSFPANNSIISSALIFGDLQARVFGKFSQESWTNVWSNSIIGNPTTSQFNDTLYPITTKNRGAAEESWALIFTNSTSFRIVGKNAGQIGTGDINTDLAPLNPATSTPYFTLNKLGWGTGWGAGNVLRFNSAAANYPVWLARTVLQGPATALNDKFQIQIRGDKDRV